MKLTGKANLVLFLSGTGRGPHKLGATYRPGDHRPSEAYRQAARVVSEKATIPLVIAWWARIKMPKSNTND